ncbi:MAG: PAS domain S-box protein [Acidimicrobiales bacterium]
MEPRATELFGYSAGEAVGASLDLIVPEEFRERHWAGFRRAIETGECHLDRAATARTGHGRRPSGTAAGCARNRPLCAKPSPWRLDAHSKGAAAPAPKPAPGGRPKLLARLGVECQLSERGPPRGSRWADRVPCGLKSRGAMASGAAPRRHARPRRPHRRRRVGGAMLAPVRRSRDRDVRRGRPSRWRSRSARVGLCGHRRICLSRRSRPSPWIEPRGWWA